MAAGKEKGRTGKTGAPLRVLRDWIRFALFVL